MRMNVKNQSIGKNSQDLKKKFFKGQIFHEKC